MWEFFFHNYNSIATKVPLKDLTHVNLGFFLFILPSKFKFPKGFCATNVLKNTSKNQTTYFHFWTEKIVHMKKLKNTSKDQTTYFHFWIKKIIHMKKYILKVQDFSLLLMLYVGESPSKIFNLSNLIRIQDMPIYYMKGVMY
jgi:hypothetical protein